MAEELTFKQCLRQSRAFHGDDVAVGAGAGLVNRAGGQLLTGAGFAQQQYRGIPGGHQVDHFQHAVERGAVAHHPLPVDLGAGDRYRFEHFDEIAQFAVGIFQRHHLHIDMFAPPGRIVDMQHTLAIQRFPAGEHGTTLAGLVAGAVVAVGYPVAAVTVPDVTKRLLVATIAVEYFVIQRQENGGLLDAFQQRGKVHVISGA